MKTIPFIILFILNSLHSLGQNVRLKTTFEGPALSITKDMVYDFQLFFISGNSDSVFIYLNKKLIRSLYVKPIASLQHGMGAPLIKFPISFKNRANLLEIKKRNSNKIYCCRLQKGYIMALLYLEDKPTVLYTNKTPDF